MKNTSKRLLIVVIVLLILITTAVVVALLPTNNNKQEEIVATEVIEEEIVQDDNELFSHDKYQDYYEINNDYIGQIIFDSEIINEPVVYSSVNSYYLRKNINKEYSIQGTVYMDERNTIDDQNVIIYGHYTESSYTDYPEYQEGVRPMFSNLELLLDKNNYEANKDVYLYLDNEVGHYVVAYVYYCPLLKDDTGEYVYVEDGYSYYYTSYTEDEFNNYLALIKEISLYDTNEDITINDKLLTLQTCVNEREDLREIVVLKLLSTETY